MLWVRQSKLLAVFCEQIQICPQMVKSYLYVFVNIFLFAVLTQKRSATISLLELITSLLNKIKDKNVNIDEKFDFTVRYFSNIDV